MDKKKEMAQPYTSPPVAVVLQHAGSMNKQAFHRVAQPLSIFVLLLLAAVCIAITSWIGVNSSIVGTQQAIARAPLLTSFQAIGELLPEFTDAQDDDDDYVDADYNDDLNISNYVPGKRKGPLQPPMVLSQSSHECSQGLQIPRVALLFLTKSHPHHSKMWELWLHSARDYVPLLQLCNNSNSNRRSEDAKNLCAGRQASDDVSQSQHLYSIYLHLPPTFNETLLDPLWRDKVIKNRIATKWGTHLLAEATRNLLWEAYQDPLNERFVLLSESDVPLYDPLTTYQQLMAVNKSIINACTHDQMHERRWDDRMEIPGVFERKHWRKSSQFWSLIRAHAKVVVEDVDIFRKFEEFCLHDEDRDCFSDEHWIPTLLAVHGRQEECQCRNGSRGSWGISFTDWRQHLPHPRTFKPEQVKRIVWEHILRKNGDDCSGIGAVGFDGTRMFSRTLSDRACTSMPEYDATILEGCNLTGRKFPSSTVSAVLGIVRNCSNGMNMLGGDPEGCLRAQQQ